MDPVTAGAIGAGVQVLGGVLGEWWGNADEEKRRALEEEAYRMYGDISSPVLERVLAEKLGPSALEGIPQDFGNRGARDRALQRIIDEGMSGGMDEQSQLAVEEGRRAAALQEQQGRQAVFGTARRRGLGGAGELAANLQAQQSGADRASLAGTQAAADARSRALQSLATGAGLASQAEGQDFERAARVAESKDRIAQFNADEASRARYYNAGLGQQEYENRLGLTDRRYDAKLNQAAGYGQRADRKRRMAGGIGQGVGYGIGSYGQSGGGK